MACCGVDALEFLNAIFCLAILVIGCAIYIATREKTPFHIGVAFGLFAVAHVIDLIGIRIMFGPTILLVRVFGYLIIISAMLKAGAK